MQETQESEDLIPGSGRSPEGKAWQLTSVFLPGESPWTEEPADCSPGVTKSQTRLTTERLSRAQQNFRFLEEPSTKEEGTTFLRLTTAPNTVISICLLFFLPRVLFLFFWKSLIKKNFIYFCLCWVFIAARLFSSCHE